MNDFILYPDILHFFVNSDYIKPIQAPLLNLRLQHAVHDSKANVGIIGLKMNLGYHTTHLGASPDTISDLADGKHPFCERK